MPTVTGDNFYIDKHTLQFRTGESSIASIAYDKTQEEISISNAGTGSINIGDAGGDIFIGERKNPLDGYISSLRYFNYALGNNKIQDIMNMGPNLKTIGEDFTETKPPYLAMRWYLDSHN